MTIKDIAKEAGVSTATVSRVINGTGPVNANVRKRIEAIIESSNYIPNAFARGITSRSMNTVGILCPTLVDTMQTTFLSNIEQNLRAKGFSTLVICNTGRETDKTPFLYTLLSKMVDGIIILGASMAEYEDINCFSVASSKVPVFVINGNVKNPDVYCIYCDEYHAVQETVSSLIARGNQRILYIYDTNTFSAYQKMQGYLSGLKKNNVDYDPNLVLQFKSSSDFLRLAKNGTYSLLSTAIRNGLTFDAIITADDILAAGAIDALIDHQIDPSAIPIVGFNNSHIAELVRPKLTSIDVLPSELCALAVMQLVGVLEGKSFPHKVSCSYSIVERDSFVRHPKEKCISE